MTSADIETVYEALAEKLDAVPPDSRELFLAKLALLLSRDLADPARVCQMIEEVALDLDV